MLPIDYELIPARFSTEYRMVLQHQTGPPCPGLPLEGQRSRKAADAAAHYDAIEYFTRIDDVLGQRVEHAIANLMAGGKDTQRVAIRPTIVTDAAISVEVV